MAQTAQTTDHDDIVKWVTDRNGNAAVVKATSDDDRPEEMIRILFDDAGGNNDGLKKVSWNEWFKVFDDQGLALLHSTEAGNTFNKLVSRN